LQNNQTSDSWIQRHNPYLEKFKVFYYTSARFNRNKMRWHWKEANFEEYSWAKVRRHEPNTSKDYAEVKKD
jgi:hypothetical protein